MMKKLSNTFKSLEYIGYDGGDILDGIDEGLFETKEWKTKQLKIYIGMDHEFMMMRRVQSI